MPIFNSLFISLYHLQMFCCSSEEEEPEKIKPNKGEDVPKGQRSKRIHTNHKVTFILLECR